MAAFIKDFYYRNGLDSKSYNYKNIIKKWYEGYKLYNPNLIKGNSDSVFDINNKSVGLKRPLNLNRKRFI
jgi:hypothetical protein